LFLSDLQARVDRILADFAAVVRRCGGSESWHVNQRKAAEQIVALATSRGRQPPPPVSAAAPASPLP